MNLTNASLFTLLPPLANIVVASFVGPLADNAIERGVGVSTVRKGAQAVAFLGPASFMVRRVYVELVLTHLDDLDQCSEYHLASMSKWF